MLTHRGQYVLSGDLMMHQEDTHTVLFIQGTTEVAHGIHPAVFLHLFPMIVSVTVCCSSDNTCRAQRAPVQIAILRIPNCNSILHNLLCYPKCIVLKCLRKAHYAQVSQPRGTGHGTAINMES
jgi:hypothetical protein